MISKQNGRSSEDVRATSTALVDSAPDPNRVCDYTEDFPTSGGDANNLLPVNSNMDSNPQTSFHPYESADVLLQTTFPTGNDLGQVDMSLFSGFDIPFWMDDDQYASLADTWDPT
jgi:hypothetical protein